ncbi:MAG: hypothetical protein JXK05_14215 [Campylobacterales bacterium]|nr:hypothetical protein [Campylobacterales bacterium]
MHIIELLILIIAFSVVLGLLIFLYVYKPAQKRKAAMRLQAEAIKSTPQRSEIPTFDTLLLKIKNRYSDEATLREAAELMLRYYGTIEPKHGVVPNKDFRRYGEAIYAISAHPNTTKELVVMFDRELSRRNPSYAREIEEMLNRGLSARV